MIGYIWYSRTALLPIGKKLQDCRWVYPQKTYICSSDKAKVSVNEIDILSWDSYSGACLVSCLTILELV